MSVSTRRLLAGAVVFLVLALPFVGYLALKLTPDLFAVNGLCRGAQTPRCLDAKARAQDRRGVTTATLAVFAGALSVVGVTVTALTYEQTRRTANKTHEREREAQITERFTHATEQIGSDKVEVRVGGLYALARIAEDSPKDSGPVAEVLSAFVRVKAPWNLEDTHPPSRGIDAANASRPPPDIQAALAAIARGEGFADGRAVVDLEGTDLRGLALLTGRRIHLEGVRFAGAHLERATLDDGHFREAVLTGADLSDAQLVEADLERANLDGARLERARLGGANLKRASFIGGHLSRAALSQACCDGAFLMRADLNGAVMTEASLRGANLDGAHLENANLRGADLDGADLRRVSANRNTRWPESFDADDPRISYSDASESD